MLVPIAKALRPHQWVKNLFVAAPLVFARRMGDLEAAGRTAAAIAAFCLLSSAVYVVNDLVDIDRDRVHPHKRRRAIASGALPVAAARLLAMLLAGAGLAIPLAVGLPLHFLGTILGYLFLNVAYMAALKKVPFVDVGTISLGFLLRVLGGAAAISVVPSTWLLICTLLLSGLLGFGKRAHELRVAGGGGQAQRDVLSRYRPRTLQTLLVVLGLLTAATYLAYTQSQHARQMFGTRNLVWTVPLVGVGVFRFVWLTSRKVDAESPTDSMLRDPLFVSNLVAYAAATFLIIYLS